MTSLREVRLLPEGHIPDVLVIGMFLADGRGTEAVEALEAWYPKNRVRVVMLVGLGPDGAPPRFVNAPVDCYVYWAKGVSHWQVVLSIEQYLLPRSQDT